MGHFYFGGAMNEKLTQEAMELVKRDMDLEKDLDVLDYNYKTARSLILNEQSRIAMRIGELRRRDGFQLVRSQGA